VTVRKTYDAKGLDLSANAPLLICSPVAILKKHGDKQICLTY